MFAKCPAGRPGTADEVANVAEPLMGAKCAFITETDILIDGGAMASYFYGSIRQYETFSVNMLLKSSSMIKSKT